PCNKNASSGCAMSWGLAILCGIRRRGLMRATELIRLLHTLTGVTPDSVQAVAGGDISPAWHAQTGQQHWFIKTGPVAHAELFAAEAAGLHALQASNTVRVPAVISYGSMPTGAYLLMEWLE